MSDLLALCGLLGYQNGRLIWIKRERRSDFLGKEAGTVSTTDGYRYVKYKGKRYAAHRLIFMIHHGFLPNEIDHINRIRTDNRIENLRDAKTHSNNLGNQSIQKRDKSSAFKGVCWDASRMKWMATIKVNKKAKHLGRFCNENDAARAYNDAALAEYGEFANLNNIPSVRLSDD